MEKPNNELKPWEVLNRTELLKTPWFSLNRDECRLPDGSVIDDYYVIDAPDVSGIVAVTPEGQLIVNKQYKHGCADMVCEIPAGMIDEGEEPLFAAQRELEEETGYVSDSWTYLGTVYSNPTSQPVRFHMYLAENCTQTDKKIEDDSREVILNELVDFELVDELIDDGTINVLWSISAIHLAQRALMKRK